MKKIITIFVTISLVLLAATCGECDAQEQIRFEETQPEVRQSGGRPLSEREKKEDERMMRWYGIDRVPMREKERAKLDVMVADGRARGLTVTEVIAEEMEQLRQKRRLINR